MAPRKPGFLERLAQDALGLDKEKVAQMLQDLQRLQKQDPGSRAERPAWASDFPDLTESDAGTGLPRQPRGSLRPRKGRATGFAVGGVSRLTESPSPAPQRNKKRPPARAQAQADAATELELDELLTAAGFSDLEIGTVPSAAGVEGGPASRASGPRGGRLLGCSPAQAFLATELFGPPVSLRAWPAPLTAWPEPGRPRPMPVPSSPEPRPELTSPVTPPAPPKAQPQPPAPEDVPAIPRPDSLSPELLFRLAVRTAVADNRVTTTEMAFFRGLRGMLGLDAEREQAILAEERDKAKTRSAPLSNAALAPGGLYLAAYRLATADRIISESERKLLEQLGTLFGLSDDERRKLEQLVPRA